MPVIVSMPQMQHPDGVAAHRRLVVSHKAILPLLCVQQRIHRRRVGLALEVQPKPGILRLTHRVKSAHYIESHIVLCLLIPADKHYKEAARWYRRYAADRIRWRNQRLNW